MSQVEATRTSKGVKARTEEFVKDFEWTWTNAVLFSLALCFFLLIAAWIIPSFWMYFAEGELGWGGPSDLEAFLKKPFESGSFLGFDSFPFPSLQTKLQIRDAIAMGLSTGPIITVLVLASVMQDWRKKLRGGGGESRPSGGYR
jgi:hypothetical protein